MDRRIGSGSGFGINGDSVSKGNEKNDAWAGLQNNLNDKNVPKACLEGNFYFLEPTITPEAKTF